MAQPGVLSPLLKPAVQMGTTQIDWAHALEWKFYQNVTSGVQTKEL